MVCNRESAYLIKCEVIDNYLVFQININNYRIFNEIIEALLNVPNGPMYLTIPTYIQTSTVHIVFGVYFKATGNI